MLQGESASIPIVYRFEPIAFPLTMLYISQGLLRDRKNCTLTLHEIRFGLLMVHLGSHVIFAFGIVVRTAYYEP